MVQELSETQHAALVQYMALKVLTNSALMYGSCVGVLLKRDLELPGRFSQGSSPRARDTKPGKLFRCAPTHVLEHQPCRCCTWAAAASVPDESWPR